MATIDSNGVLFYQDTDSFTPPASLNLAQANLSSLLGESPRFKRVANTTARTALVSSIGLSNITPDNPLLVWRADAAAGSQLEYTTNGTTWNVIVTNAYLAAQDTGWVAATLRPGFTGYLRVRRIGLIVHMESAVTGSLTANTTTGLADIPVGFRPTSIQGVPAVFSNGEIGWGNVAAGGGVNVRKPTTGSSTYAGCGTWVV